MPKKKRFKLDVPEKNARLDVRITASLRKRVEDYCMQNSKKLTTAITEALEDYLKKHLEK